MNEAYLITFGFLIQVGLAEITPATVNLPLGIVEGYVKQSFYGKKFYAFEGIPYARPPVGEYRFKEPGAPVPWKGILKATTTYKCIQYDHYTIPGADMVSGDEDCLFVNIYTPDPNPKKKFNVMVHIHGGAFMFGQGANYGPGIIMDRDIIYVNLNYRVGPLGFLSTEDDAIPGNNGLRDQILALKWIKENIVHFGGDPNSITISGMSAGGASVEFHYLFSESKGLFKAGISQSGSVLEPWVLVENSLQKAKKVSNLVGCPFNNTKLMVDCLKTKHARQIVQTVSHFQPYMYNPFSPFGVVVDSWAKQPLIPEHPYKILQNKKVLDVPWMISYVSEEGLYPGADFYADEHLEYIDKNWNKIIPYVLHYNEAISESRMDDVSQKIKEEYLKGEKLSKKTYSKLIQAMSDRLFLDDIEKAARLHNLAVKSPVYTYMFDYRGLRSSTEVKANCSDNIGVSHADDTAYVLYSDYDTLSTPEDREISKIMVDMFVSFMETGKANISVNWEPLSKDTSAPWRQLHITSPRNIYMEEIEDNIGNRAFWKSLGFEENEQLLM